MQYVALLRGINVGKNNRVKMETPKNILIELGFQEIHALLQSGNLVFTGPNSKSDELEKVLEKATLEATGIDLPYLIRTADEWRESIANNPFKEEVLNHPDHVLNCYLKDKVNEEVVLKTLSKYRSNESIAFGDRIIYLDFPVDIGNSLLARQLNEKNLGTKSTARNWTTVDKIANLLK